MDELTAPHEEEYSFEEIRTKCETLISSSKIEKDDSLNILKLQFEIELLAVNMIHSKDKQLEHLKHEIELQKAINKNSELLQIMSSDIINRNKRINQLYEQFAIPRKK